jgi:hypothetical protein
VVFTVVGWRFTAVQRRGEQVFSSYRCRIDRVKARESFFEISKSISWKWVERKTAAATQR